jgi:hypothetical protein
VRFKGFIGPTYQLSSVDYECQRCINLYLEKDEIGTGKDGEPMSLIGTPGLTLLATIGNGPIRGVWYTTTGVLYVVSGNSLYSVTSAWAATLIGTLQTTSGPVGMADDGFYLVVVDGANGYYVDFTIPGTLTQITDPNWLGSDQVAFMDGYFIFKAPNSAEFYLSDPNAITFTAPANTAKDGYPDQIVSFISVNRNLWLFGDQTTEVFFDSGAALNPFAYIPGTLMMYGSAATFGVAQIFNTVVWLGKDQSGSGVVYVANGYSPVRISTHAVELAFQSYSTISDAIAYSYQENGHQFYVINFPTASATWAYDFETQQWHERAYLSAGNLQRHRSNCYAYAFDSVHVVGDYANGNLYQMSSSVYTDNGAAILRQRISPHISSDMNRVFHKSFQLDCETNIGLDGSGQGTNPQAMLQWSNDGGHTWSNEMWSTMCKIGNTTDRVIFRRLGQSRNRVYKVSISDPIKVVMIGATLEIEQGAS